MGGTGKEPLVIVQSLQKSVPVISSDCIFAVSFTLFRGTLAVDS